MVDKLKEYTGEVIPSESSNTPEGLTEYTGEVLDPLTPDYSFGQLASKSFDRGLERFKSTYGDVLPAMALSTLGFDEAAKRQMEEARQSEEYIQRTMRPQFASFRDVNWANPIDISKFIIETTGEQIPNLAGILVPGGIGAKGGEMLLTNKALKTLAPKITDKAQKKVLKKYLKTSPDVVKGRNIGQTSGIFLGSYGLNAPEVFQNIYEQTGSFEPGAAALAGVINASLDSILPATILNQFGRPGRATIVSEILERSGMSPNLARKAVVQIAGSGVLEGLTEATQEAVSITAENFVQDHSYLFDSEDFERLLEGGVRGTVAGGAFRGVGVAASNLRDKYFKTEADKKDGKEGTATDTGTETPPTTLEEQQLLLEQQKRLTDQTIYGQDLTGPRQLELDLEGGMAQGELDFDTGPVGEQLELEGLGPKPTVGPLAELPDIYEARGLPTRQTELDFETQVAQIEEELVGPPTQQQDLFAPVAPKPTTEPTQSGLELEGGVAQPELPGIEPKSFTRTGEEQLDSAEPTMTKEEVLSKATGLEYNIASSFQPNPPKLIAELQELRDTYPEVFAERDFVETQLGMERFEMPYEGGFKNVTKLSDTLLANLPSPETERQKYGGSKQTGPGLYKTLFQNYRDKIKDKKLVSVYDFMYPVISNALRNNGIIGSSDILIEDANDIPVASVKGSIRKASPKRTEKLLRNASKDELLKSKTISKELYNDPEFRFAPITPDRLAGARISKPKTPLVYFPAAYYMEQITSVDKKGADALIEAAISKAKNEGVRYLVAEDFTSTQALNAFRNRGFKDATKYLFKGEALDTPVDYRGDIKRKRGIIKKNLYLDIEADVKAKKPIPPVNPKENVITVLAGTPLYHGSSSQVDGIKSSLILQSKYTGEAKGDGGGTIEEGGLVWLSKKKKWAAQFGGGQEATVFSYTPKQDLNLLNRDARITKKQADILNEIVMPRFGFSQAEINAVKKGGRYVKSYYSNNPFSAGTDVIAGANQKFQNYAYMLLDATRTYSPNVLESYKTGPAYELGEAGEKSIKVRNTRFVAWPFILTPLGYDGFYYGEAQYALVGNRRVEFAQEPKVKKKFTARDTYVKYGSYKKPKAKKKVAKKKVATATPEISGIDSSLLNKEIEVTRQGKKQKGTYIEIDGSPYISYPYKGGTVKSAILPNDKVKEVKIKKEAAEEVPLKSIRKGRDSDKPIINRLKSKKTLGAVLNILNKANITLAQKLLVRVLLTVPNIGKTKFRMVDDLEFQNNAYGEYNRQQDTIQLSNNADVETVLHEAVHAATANLLNKHIRDGVGLTPLGKQIIRLYEDAIAADTEGRFTTALSKVDEFIAESFTNPEFQKFLAINDSSFSGRLRGEDSAYEGSLKAQGVRPNVIQNIMNERRGVNNFLSSIWSGFVSAVKDMLGITNTDFSYSILNDVIALAPELFVGPNKREQAGATQELLFKKSVIQMLQDSGAMAGKYTKKAITPRIAENIAEVIGRQPIADNRAGRSLVRNISNAPQALLDVYAKILSLPQQIEMFGEYLPSLSDVRRFLEIKAFDIKKGREEIERLVAFGESLKDKYTSTTAGKKVFKEWNQVLLGLSGLDTNPDTILADPNGLANLTKENPKAAALVRRYEKLPQDLKNLSGQIVTDLEVRYKKLLDTVLADIDRNEDGSMKDFEKVIREQYKSRPFYLPFVRKGDYWFEYQTRDGEYGQASADSAANRSIKIKRMKKEDGITDVKLITRDSAMASTGMVPNNYIQALKEGLEGIDLTPEQQVAINSLIQETQVALFPNESLSNNRKTRKAVPGYIEDIVFAYADVAPKIVSSTANQQYNKQLVVAINKVGKEANEPAAVNSNLVRAVANNVIGRSGFMLNPIASDMSRYAAYGSYFWFLGFNVSSAIVNITQIPLVVVPYLAGEYTGLGVKGQGKAWSEIQKAMKLYFSGPGKKGFFQTENTGRFAPDATMAPVKIDLETGEKTYLGPNAKLFKPGGKYHDLFNKAEEAAALRRGVGYEIVELNRDLGAEVESGNRIKAKAEKLVGYMFQNSERFNREVTLVSAFEMELQYGSGNKDVAIQKAIEFTSKVHSHALPEVGPSLFQDGLGKIMFVFKRFAQAQAYLIMKLFYDGPFKFSRNIKNNPNLTEEEKTQLLAEKLAAKKQLAGIYGYSFLMAGAAGVPLYGLMKMIMEGLFDDDDEPFDFDVFVNQAIGDMGYRGPLSYAIGADVSRRTGYNNLFFQEDPQRLAEIGLPTYALETMFGPAFSGVRRFASGFEYLQRGQEMRALERFTPTAISNTVKALRQSMEGVRNKNGVKIIEDDPSLYESFMQIVGFTNPEVSEAYARAEALKGPERKLNLRRQNLLLRYWLASQEGDTDAVKDIIEEMKEFNKKVPSAMRITPAVRNRSKKARQKSTNDSVFGINLPKTYKDDMEDIYDIDTGNILDLDIFD